MEVFRRFIEETETSTEMQKHANKIDIRFDFCGEQMINGSHIHTSQAKTVPAIQKIRIITETGTGVAKTLMVPNLHAGATSYKLRIFINRMN